MGGIVHGGEKECLAERVQHAAQAAGAFHMHVRAQHLMRVRD